MRSLISIDFPAPEPQPIVAAACILVLAPCIVCSILKAHMWYQLSPFPSSNAAIAMQQHPGNIHQSVATPRYSATPWYVLIQLPNVDTISKR